MLQPAQSNAPKFPATAIPTYSPVKAVTAAACCRGANGGWFMSDALAGRTAVSVVAAARPLPAIAVGGLIAGTLDLTYAILVYSRRNPIRVPQHIASGLLGTQSFSGGATTATLGVLLHFVIALGAATVYFLASRKLTLMAEHAVLCGMIFGGLVYIFMHTVVIPLSAIHPRATPFVYQATEFVWHWIGVGLPIALSVRHFSR